VALVVLVTGALAPLGVEDALFLVNKSAYSLVPNFVISSFVISPARFFSLSRLSVVNLSNSVLFPSTNFSNIFSGEKSPPATMSVNLPPNY
jgi:hypothetical protein